MDDPKSFDQLLKNGFLSKNNFSIDINNQDLVIKSNENNYKYKIGTITFDTYNVEEIKEELNSDDKYKDNEVLQKIIEEEEEQKGGKRKTRRNRKTKKGKRSRKARKSRRKSNRRRGRR